MTHVYTGKGKGKTTAALGLAIRALGRGLNVCLVQFMKKGEYGEIKSLKKHKKITVKQFGRRFFVSSTKPVKEDIRKALEALEFSQNAIRSKKYNLIVLDEINVAVKYHLIKPEDILELIRITPLSTELVLTGRYAHAKIIERADLVTEMKEVKHYYKKGRKARSGIEY